MRELTNELSTENYHYHVPFMQYLSHAKQIRLFHSLCYCVIANYKKIFRISCVSQKIFVSFNLWKTNAWKQL